MRFFQRQTVIAVVGALLLTASMPLFSQTLSGTAVYAQTGSSGTIPSATPGAIVVVGEGTARVEPDIAVANIGVQVANEDVRAASSEAQAIMNAVLAAIQEQGIAEEDIQTSGFSIFADFGPVGPAGEQPQTPL